MSSDLFATIGEQVDAAMAARETNGNTGTNGTKAGNEIQSEVDGENKFVDEIESMCMNCHENGVTRLLLTKIPYFREVILMSFACDKCGFQNNEIQSAGAFQPKGVHYELRLTSMPDFERQVVKSDTATIKFIELDVEIPAGRGQLTNVEGLLSTIIDDLEVAQPARKEKEPEVYSKIQEIITKGRAMLAGDAFPFRLAVDDPAGNSFITPDVRDGVGKLEKREYPRTPEQNSALGLADTAVQPAPSLEDEDIVPDQVYQFPASCPGCMHPCITNMKMVDIPHFRQVVIMNTSCDDCGYKSNDVKTGGEVPEKGKKVTLLVRTNIDLARDILKSESCALECPELSLSVNPGTLGGRFTTVEGLLTQVRDDLQKQIFQGTDGGELTAGGDSLANEERARWDAFFEKLDRAIKGEVHFTIILADPLACSYVQSLADDPTKPDDQMVVEEYDRTAEEEEELGLTDMKTENYAEDAE
ncbi:ZPR1 zinc-finger domain-containing protein [Podospora appendiculata]|uniref:ZPR1 zinc-finger domain-containing protein n=1 Tax=Podospora appendiculata TaxID=314037 RepID=A0AAE1C929_9PEZI|nr:ZPR1 zinc-finger domain-containing protein [Podospora appendiculata]